MDDENFVHLSAWMVDRLGLKGNDLIAYAIVYGFSQDGKGWYYGGREYLAGWIGCNEKTAGAVLARLTDAGLLRKVEQATSNGRRNLYQVIRDGAENALPIGRKTHEGWGEKRPMGGAKNAPLNKKGELKEEIKRESKRVTRPTREEIEEYATEKGYEGFDADRFIDYYTSNGWMVGRSPMRDWKATVRNWARRDNGKRPQKQALHDAVFDIPDDYRAVVDRINGGV